MAQRRSAFGAKYGSAKIEQGKSRGPKLGAMTAPPVPLSLMPQRQSMDAPVMPGQASMSGDQRQAQAQGQGQPQGDGLEPGMEQLLQQLLRQFGGGGA